MAVLSEQGLENLARIRQANPITEEKFASKPLGSAKAASGLPQRGASALNRGIGAGKGLIRNAGAGLGWALAGEGLARGMEDAGMIDVAGHNAAVGDDAPQWLSMKDSPGLLGALSGAGNAIANIPNGGDGGLPPRFPQTAIEDTAYMKAMGRDAIGSWQNTGPRIIGGSGRRNAQGELMPDKGKKILLTNLDPFSLNEEMNLDTMEPRNYPRRNDLPAYKTDMGGAPQLAGLSQGGLPMRGGAEEPQHGKSYTIGAPDRHSGGWFGASLDDLMERKRAATRERLDLANREMANKEEDTRINAFKAQNENIGKQSEDYYRTAMGDYYRALASAQPSKEDLAREKIAATRLGQIAKLEEEMFKLDEGDPKRQDYFNYIQALKAGKTPQQGTVAPAIMERKFPWLWETEKTPARTGILPPQ